MRYAFVAREWTRYPVRLLCRVLAVSVSGFHIWRCRQGQPDPHAALRAKLRTIHAASRGTYGRPRMVQALCACAYAVGHKRVARLMREEGLPGRHRSTISRESHRGCGQRGYQAELVARVAFKDDPGFGSHECQGSAKPIQPSEPVQNACTEGFNR